MRLRLVITYTFAMFVAPLAAQATSPLPDSALRTAIQQARATDATPFANVSDVIAHAPDKHAAARGRHAPVAQTLARLGPPAVLPILELLVDSTHPLAPASRRDLIEAAGLLRDARALPVLGAVLTDPREEAETTRTTAEAMARIGTPDAAAQLLAALNGAAGERERALVAGLGECRRSAVTDALAVRVRKGDDAMVLVAARSLGRAGNAWAWKTLADHAEEAKIRETAARALVDAFVAHSGEARQAASNALLVVDAPITPALIAEARAGGSPATQAALDSLAERFAKNPAR